MIVSNKSCTVYPLVRTNVLEKMFYAFVAMIQEQFLVSSHIRGAERERLVREKIVDAIGSFLGMGGAIWFALKITGYDYAFIPYFASSVIMCYRFFVTKNGYFMLQQLVFSFINLAGIYVWLLKG